MFNIEFKALINIMKIKKYLFLYCNVIFKIIVQITYCEK